MRAVHVTAFGGPEVLRPVDLPVPEPGPGELLIDVAAAGVLFLDTQLRAGWGQDYFQMRPPYVPGAVVAGTVADVGAGVPTSWLGRSVIASTSEPGEHRGGGYAEHAVAPVTASEPIPDGLDPVDALAAHDGVMAVSHVAQAGLKAGDSALVTAASGSIGTLLVPMLHDAGVRVLAAARGPAKTGLAIERGADVGLDYSDENWTAGVDGRVDAVFDGAGGDLGAAAFDLLRPGGVFFSYGAAAGAFAGVENRAAERDIRVVGIHDGLDTDDMRGAMREALRLLATGRLKPVIGLRLPFERADQAHRAMAERRVLGKTVLTP